MKVAVIGGRGFVGEAVVDALDAHDVTTVDPKIGGPGHVSADITVPESIVSGLDGFDAVVNLAGLSPMRKPRGTSYDAVHADGARNVVAACRANGIEKLVHMSALGADPDADTAYMRTKGEGESAVLESGLDVTVLRPSFVLGRGNELVAMAERWAPTRVFPRLTSRVQPITRRDVAALFRMAVEGEVDRDAVDVGGPDAVSLYRMAATVYGAVGYPCWPLPVQAVLVTGCYAAAVVPFLPWGADQARFLRRDSVTGENDAAELVDLETVDDWVNRAY